MIHLYAGDHLRRDSRTIEFGFEFEFELDFELKLTIKIPKKKKRKNRGGVGEGPAKPEPAEILTFFEGPLMTSIPVNGGWEGTNQR